MSPHRLSQVSRLLFLLVLLPASALLMPRTLHAQINQVICSVQARDISFGSIDPGQSGDIQRTGSVSFSCVNSFLLPLTVTACLNIGAGNSASGNTAPRDMDGSASPPLHFQLYKDANHTQIWGSTLTSATPSPVQVQFPIAANSRYDSPSYPMYGVVPGSQTSVAVGSYRNDFASPSASLSRALGFLVYPANCGSNPDTNIDFVVSAAVQPVCTVSATDLKFGNVAGLLSSSNHDGNTTVGVRCVSPTAYKIGLDNGLHANGNTRRMAGPGGQLVQYELYRDSGYTLRWGNTPGTDTVSGIGIGIMLNSTVYGRVPVQTTPSAGTYNDTVTVTITY